MAIPRVLATELLKHRIKHKGKYGEGKRVYIIFWVNFKTGKIEDSLTHPGLKADKFMHYKTSKEYEDFIIV